MDNAARNNSEMHNRHNRVNNNREANSRDLAKDLIKQFEGLRLTAYHCSAGLKTIGYGHVIKPNEQKQLGNRITIEIAERLLDQDIEKARISLYRYCQVPLTYQQQAALISFIFNCGSGAFQASTLRQKLNRGEYTNAADELLKWVHSKGKRLNGLIKRRNIERAVFLEEIDILLLINKLTTTKNVIIAARNSNLNSNYVLRTPSIIVDTIKRIFRKLDKPLKA